MPILTILVPVRNGEIYLKACLNSILSQSFTDYVVLVSDNASTDRTREIVEKFASVDSRIAYRRHSNDLGLEGNLKWLIQNTVSEYLTIWAVDDVRSPDTLRESIQILISDPQSIGATAKWRFDIESDDQAPTSHIGSIDSDIQAARIAWIGRNVWGTSGLSFAVFRTSVIKAYSPEFFDGFFFGNDVCRLAFTLMHGKISTAFGNSEIILGSKGDSNSTSPFQSLRKSRIEIIFPLFLLSAYLLRLYSRATGKNKLDYWRFFAALLYNNFVAQKIQISRFVLTKIGKLK
jgi:glycosyltransferase involved in cell wall biosynthesis